MTSIRFARMAAVGSLVLLAADVSAQSIDDAKTAYSDGLFVEAADLAETLETSEGFALAAQSLAVYAYFEATEEEWEEVVERAMRMGEEAVKADPNNPDAHYQSAHAVGRYAQGMSAWTALRQGLAGKIRDLLEATIAFDPDYVDAILALGGWHADIAVEGFIGSCQTDVCRGKKEEAIILFERAGLDPVAKLMQVHGLVLQRPPQPFDEDVVEEPAPAVHRERHARRSAPGRRRPRW